MSATKPMHRPLSPMERWYWICDQISPLNVVARVHVDGRCHADDLHRAAEELAREHPLLTVTVTADPPRAKPRFTAPADPRIPVRVVLDAGEDRGRREIDRELATSVADAGTPLARVVLISDQSGAGHELLLTVSHIIADGTTALTLLSRLTHLAAPDARADPRPVMPAPESMLPSRINRLPRLAHLAMWLLADNIQLAVARPRRLQALTPVDPAARRSRLLHRELDAGHLAAVVAWCRREQITVHAALTAALALSTGQEQGAAGRVCVGSPVDFRAELTPPVGPAEAGAYVATVPTYVRVGPGVGLATAARAVTRDLRRRRRWHHHLALVSLLPLISPRSVEGSGRSVALVDRVGPGNVCVSNLGRYDFPERAGRWRLSGAQFIAGISVSGYLVAAVNTSHGVLQCNVTYIEGAVTAERAARITDQAVSLLLGAAGVTPADRPHLAGASDTKGWA